eukprot:3498451-Rhodomonas_salina.2
MLLPGLAELKLSRSVNHPPTRISTAYFLDPGTTSIGPRRIVSTVLVRMSIASFVAVHTLAVPPSTAQALITVLRRHISLRIT